MATPPPAVLEQRRATVRQLHDAGHSNRAIARQFGIGKDAVARDLRATEPATSATATTPGAPDAATGEPHPAPLARATPHPARAARAPLTLTSGNTVRPWLVHDLDPQLVQDLNVLVDRSTGQLPAPLERAIHIAAVAARASWNRATPSHPRATETDGAP